MKSTAFRLAALAVFAAVVPASGQELLLKEGDGKHWFKGQTHVHTLWSDGDGAPEIPARWYKEHGYHFLSITDHNIMLRGERWFAVTPDGRLTPARLGELIHDFGLDWVELREGEDTLEMRLKTLEELKARFDEPGVYLLVEGEEITASEVHVNAINLREVILPEDEGRKGQVFREQVVSLRRQGERLREPMLAHLNHPNWGPGFPAEELVAVGEGRFFEVYNGHGGVMNWGDAQRHRVPTERLWDIALTFRLRVDPEAILYGVATDDAHNYFRRGEGGSIPGRGWIRVLAEDLSMGSILPAMERGEFYASAGVELQEISWDGREYRVRPAPEEGVTYTTTFYGTRRGFDDTAVPVVDAEGNALEDVTWVYSEEVGEVLFVTTEVPAVYRARGDEMYIRATVVSSQLKEDPFRAGDREMAWTQPVVMR